MASIFDKIRADYDALRRANEQTLRERREEAYAMAPGLEAVEEIGGKVALFEKTNEKAKKGTGLIGTFRVVNQKELEKIKEDYRLFRYNKDGSLIFVWADKPSLKDPVLKKAYEEGVGKAGDILQTVK